MTEPGFRVEGRQQTAPFLARNTFYSYHYFRDAKCSVLVKPEAARGMRAAAVRAQPHETGGLLSGRALRDDEGSYVVISGFVEAPPNAGQPATFRINPEEVREMRADAARADPGADEVGWWHTHRSQSSFSQIDRNTQQMFERPDSVGLLVFAGGQALATAYVGPDARDLGCVRVPQGGRPPARTAPDDQGADQPAPAQRGDEPAGWPGPAAPIGRGPVNGVLNIPGPPAGFRAIKGQALLLVLIVVILVVLLVGLLNISGQFGNLKQTMTGQLRQLASQNADNYGKLSSQMASTPAAPTASAAPSAGATPSADSTASAGSSKPSVSWSCDPQPQQGYWYCTAVSSKGTGTWTVEWYVNSKPVGGGRSDVFLPAHKKETVQAVLESPSGTNYNGPVRTLTNG